MLKVSELELWGDFAQRLLGLVLAGDSAGRLSDTLSRLVCTGQRTLDRVGATLSRLVRLRRAQATTSHDCWAMCWLATASAAASMPLLCPRTKIMADTLA